ncbi:MULTISPECIES: DUF3899 domain-containing protein [unclassified Sporosarcina]|uniref:DUF3899 domain-containing protein n=1 Tax=unclassified Sporosarcina TaxID=2647733 RepID=UPI000C16DEB9|nr:MULTISPECIES: DUF3899 domain-containing protein [unclassified Sporosarcina]PID05576.1 hypothetical protein CSV66_09205 [Sporosarcina sp. P30]PID08770.1 hypothetical protein CSV65_09205 [Sporosarcina sp. P31]PID11942.1 hypothetical protein CSV64_09315 [Sporosarcina sp. P32b]
MKRNSIVFLISQLVIVISVYSVYGKISLLGYINASFFVSGFLLFIGGVVFVVRTGSFDFFMKSSRKVFARKGQREVIESMRAPSEVLSASPAWFFIAGIPTFILMIVALGLYYL